MNTTRHIFFPLVFIFILSWLVQGCKENTSEDIVVVIDKSYFPIDTGTWVIYTVQSIHIDSLSNVYDTSHYTLKEVFESWFVDNQGNQAARLERYIKIQGQLNWQIADVWSVNYSGNSAHKVEENIRLVKLQFPVALQKSWNGNAYNTLEEMPYTITAVHEAETINNLAFDSVVTVTQKDEESCVGKKYYIEKYAKNVGLTYKFFIDIEAQNLILNCSIPADKRITKGDIYEQKIVSFGKN